MIRSYDGSSPQLGPRAFVAETALVLGRVTLGEESSVWYGTVIRGDVNEIWIGQATNIQDNCVVHVSTETFSTRIGDRVTVGHGAMIHGCTIGSESLVGIGAILLDGVEVGAGSVVAAGSLLPPGKRYPPKSLIVGSPAVVKREVTDEELAWIRHSAAHYVTLARQHAELTLLP